MTTRPFTNPDAGKGPEQLLTERTRRLQDAMQLKQPDRVPIQLPMSYMLADMYGISHQEQHEDANREMEMLEKAALYFQPDSIMGLYNNPGPSLALGDRMTKFPGHGLSSSGSFQFVEGEYMKGEDYDDFIEDPADWSIRKYWPRVFSELEGLALLPPLGIAAYGTYSLSNLGVFKTPPVVKALRALARAVEAQGCHALRGADNSRLRLQYLAELPKGKTVGWFQASDIFKTKKIVGDTMCIVRGMPNSLLKGGTVEQVRQLTIRLCKEAGKGGGFIITTSAGEMEGCRPELVKVWVETTKEFGVYK